MKRKVNRLTFDSGPQKTGFMQIDEFTERVLPLNDRLFRFACSFLKDREDARDAVQDVLLRLWEMRDLLEKERRQRGRVRSMRYTLVGIAASLLVAMGSLFWYQQQPDYRDTFDDPEEALAVAGETLAFVSAKYNKGVEKLSSLEKLSESIQPARKHLGTLKKGFDKADLFGHPEEP